mgnify:FL=1
MILKGKKALVTGATGGLGRQICFSLAFAGCKVYATGTNTAKLDELKFLINSIHGACLGTYELDLTDEKSIKKTCSDLKVDILINCAGVFPIASLEKSTIKEFDKCMAVNLRAPFILTKFLINHMKNQGWGRIVNVGSSSAYGGFKDTSVYCTSKHGLLGLSRSLYNEYRESGVKVFSVSPGSIKTPMGETIKNQDYNTFMEPKEIADFITKIISYDGNMIPEETRLNRVIVK